jgi:ATP-dependent exoDNAse (exonuclease V) alpha subunit
MLLLCDSQIISPTKKGFLGTFELNLTLQPLMNPNCSSTPSTPPTQYYRNTRSTSSTSSLTSTFSLEEDSEADDVISSSSSFPWTVGDRVVHTKNDVDLDVYNGDMGYVIKADAKGKTLEVSYPSRPGSGGGRGRGHVVKYEKAALKQLQLAWASTVHKVREGGGA